MPNKKETEEYKKISNRIMSILDIIRTRSGTATDQHFKDMISKINKDNLNSLSILELLDNAVNASSADSFVVSTLEILMHELIEFEETDYNSIVEQATWRKTKTNEWRR